MGWVIGVQTFILAVDPEVAGKPALAPLRQSLGAPGDKPTKLGQTVDFE